jgi:hypothetical protein
MKFWLVVLLAVVLVHASRLVWLELVRSRERARLGLERLRRALEREMRIFPITPVHRHALSRRHVVIQALRDERRAAERRRGKR